MNEITKMNERITDVAKTANVVVNISANMNGWPATACVVSSVMTLSGLAYCCFNLYINSDYAKLKNSERKDSEDVNKQNH